MNKNKYIKSNPGVINAKLLAPDLQTLVDKKQMRFPDIRRTITKIGVEEKGKEYEIITESIHFKLQ